MDVSTAQVYLERLRTKHSPFRNWYDARVEAAIAAWEARGRPPLVGLYNTHDQFTTNWMKNAMPSVLIWHTATIIGDGNTALLISKMHDLEGRDPVLYDSEIAHYVDGFPDFDMNINMTGPEIEQWLSWSIWPTSEYPASLQRLRFYFFAFNQWVLVRLDVIANELEGPAGENLNENIQDKIQKPDFWNDLLNRVGKIGSALAVIGGLYLAIKLFKGKKR